MKNPKHEKSVERSEQWIEQTANQTNNTAKDDHWFSTKSVGKLAAERTRDHGSKRKQRNDESFVVGSTKFGKKLGELRDDHVKTRKEQERTQAEEPELIGVYAFLFQQNYFVNLKSLIGILTAFLKFEVRTRIKRIKIFEINE